jgi:hypothetical protein
MLNRQRLRQALLLGAKDARRIIAIVRFEGCDETMPVTPTRFSSAASSFAELPEPVRGSRGSPAAMNTIRVTPVYAAGCSSSLITCADRPLPISLRRRKAAKAADFTLARFVDALQPEYTFSLMTSGQQYKRKNFVGGHVR